MKRLFIFLLTGYFFLSPVLSWADILNFPMKIESRRGSWIGLQADVELKFQASEGQSASCLGTIAYHRLDERLLLQCYDTQKKLLFAFVSTDTDFKLYLPAQKAVYEGSIFDLEDSPNIHSHLKALDLYRALKPFSVPDKNTRIEMANDLAVIEVFNKKQSLIRKLEANLEGDVLSETFYTPEGERGSKIMRENFKPVQAGPKELFFFPHRIGILDKSGRQTLIIFSKTIFMADLGEKAFVLNLPQGTKAVPIVEN